MNAPRLLLALMTMVVAAVFGSSGAFAQERNLFAVLRGPNENPSADPDGAGTVMVTFRNPTLTQICVVIFVDAIDVPNAAHIHRGGGGVNGPIVVPLAPPASGAAAVSRTCAAIAPALSAQIRSNPAAFYVNVHTGVFPGGAVRGQLF
jgi:hypothetical protein